MKKSIRFALNLIAAVLGLIAIGFLILYLLGLKIRIVESGSMEPEIPTGSLCIVDSKAEYEKIREGDVVAFKAANGKEVTHRVISVTKDGFVTKGDANDLADGVSTTRENYLGKTIFHLARVGGWIAFLQTTPGKITGVTVILALALLGSLFDTETKQDHNSKEEKSYEQKNKNHINSRSARRRSYDRHSRSISHGR